MLNKKVEVDDEDNFYNAMIGLVIEELPTAVLVSINFNDFEQEVYFYKYQVKLFIA